MAGKRKASKPVAAGAENAPVASPEPVASGVIEQTAPDPAAAGATEQVVAEVVEPVVQDVAPVVEEVVPEVVQVQSEPTPDPEPTPEPESVTQELTSPKEYPITVTVISRCYVPFQVPAVGLDLPAYASTVIEIKSPEDMVRMKNDLSAVANIHGFGADAFEVQD